VARIVDTYGRPAGHRPGFVALAGEGAHVADDGAFVADAALRDASEQLHEGNKKRLASLWRKRRHKKRAPQPQGPFRRGRGGAFPVPRPGDGFDDGDDDDSGGADLAGLTLDEPRARAERARDDRDQRLMNGPWKDNR
jgi:hypothetical protein